MTKRTIEMPWADPLLPRVSDPHFEEVVKDRFGKVPDIYFRVSPSKWLREAVMEWPQYRVQYFPSKLGYIAGLICAQENACRYCIGVTRAYLKSQGYNDNFINMIERDRQLAELNEKERVFVQFCRSLSRSSPRPPKSLLMRLQRLGYSELAVKEMAWWIVANCFINRVSTFISVPPMADLERMSRGLLGKIFRRVIKKRLEAPQRSELGTKASEQGQSFVQMMDSLKGLPAADYIGTALQGAMQSDILSKELKILMFSVVAKTLQCEFCISESKEMALNMGFDEDEYELALVTLNSKKLSNQESEILKWTRETIHFDTFVIQGRVKELSTKTDNVVLLEAIGLASLANAIVRLAILIK
ncbi:MAG: hypothetical protein KTR24_12860 [Saprospiraceae bacterium]|nr:hypothetical protein [Saprospiraceae bacterium]